jgi:predicted ATP-dependent endonuclease of OLD family
MGNNTKGIGFKNFRRFENFPLLEFGNITYMVGRNNSGKSTMVKALLLVMDYLQNQLDETFSFDNKVLEDANIVTFGRAKCNLIDEPKIVFSFKLNNYDIIIHISGDTNDTKANVILLSVKDEENGYQLLIDYLSEYARIIKKSKLKLDKLESLKELAMLGFEIDSLRKQQQTIKNKGSKEALDIVAQINKTIDRKEKLEKTTMQPEELVENIEYEVEYPMGEDFMKTAYGGVPKNKQDEIHGEEEAEVLPVDESEDEKIEDEDVLDLESVIAEQNQLKEIISNLISNNNDWRRILLNKESNKMLAPPFMNNKKVICQECDLTWEVTLEDIGEFPNWSNPYICNNCGNNNRDAPLADIIALDNKKSELKAWADNLVNSLEQESFFYLGANPSKQSALFLLRAKDNSLAQAIHQFYQLNIKEGEKEYEFVKHWMNEFEVGQSFEIKFYAGEAYEFHVLDKNGVKNHLSDKGMGSLQAMVLILNVASLIKINEKETKAVTLLVEEPELNLHPALQSKLTEFFHEVNKKYGFNFIIETHSEYMIRKSQVLVNENEYGNQDSLNPNPFKTYYFPVSDKPYEMRYRKDGKFKDEFKKGFFEVSSDLAFDIL